MAEPIAKRFGALPYSAVVSMIVAALARGDKYPGAGKTGNRCWVDGMEPICAGLISGCALMGVANAIVNVLMNEPNRG